MPDGPASRLRVHLLGPVSLHADGRELHLGTPGQRCLFAVLAMTPRTPVSAVELIDRMWNGRPPDSAREVLYTYVTRLRRVLDGLTDVEPVGRALLARRNGGYALEVEPSQVDLHQARCLARRARSMPPEDPARVELYTSACGLWTGTPLAGLETEWADRLRVALRSEHAALLAGRFDAELRVERPPEDAHALTAELVRAQSEYPLDEPLAGLLMRALDRSGHWARALEVYRRLRRRLVDELGAEPGLDLQRLHTDLLRRDPDASIRTDRHPTVAAAAPWVIQRQLPADLSSFTGRADIVDRLVATLATGPGSGDTASVVTVSGPPGVGKSTLAIRVAQLLRESFGDGQWYVHLGGLETPRSPGEILTELLEASGVDAGAIPDDADRRAAVLRSRLSGRRVLLVLDDAASAGQIRPLLPGVSDSAVLITSRRTLSGLDDHQPLPLGPLTQAESMELLTVLLGQDRPAAEPGPAAELCRLCAGWPLALRIAAARLAADPSRTLARAVSRLRVSRDRLDELAVDDVSVRTGLEVSHRALDPALRLAFVHLGAVGSVDLAGWSVGVLGTGNPASGDRLVERLIAEGLLDPVGPDPTGEPRYRFHPLVADYAAELAGDGADDEPPGFERLLAALTTLAESAYRRVHLDPTDLPATTDRPTGGLPAVDTARLATDPVAWLTAERRVLTAVIDRGIRVGRYAEAAQLADRALVHTLRAYLGSDGISLRFARIADAARDAGDEQVRWRATGRLATELAVGGGIASAADLLLECTVHVERLGMETELVFCLAEAGKYRAFDGDVGMALGPASRAWRIAAGTGGPSEALAARDLAAVHACAGRFELAEPLYQRSIDLATELGSVADHTAGLMMLSAGALNAGRLDQAEEAWRRANESVDGTTDPRGVAWLQVLAARLAEAREKPPEALRAARDALARFVDLGDGRGSTQASTIAARLGGCR